jgi:tellurite resistance protein TerC
VFAILNLRSLYFALAGLLEKFRYLKSSLVFVLAFVGVKMLIPKHVFHIPTEASLIVIAGALLAGGLASVIWPGPRSVEGDPARAEQR